MSKVSYRQDSGRTVISIILLLILLFVFFAWNKRQDIYDWSRLRDYNAPQQIEQLAFDTTMTNSARKLFYVYHPELNGRTEFSTNCSGFGEKTIVLGCYIQHRGIYIFKVDDKRLDGVEQVTAAHEMLHAAYDRLSISEKSRIDGLTNTVYSSLSDERVKQSVENYRSRDPSVLPNELHSILATEVQNLPSELEQYYNRYFNNREAVVSFAKKYESALTEQRNRIASLELQISGLKNDINHIEDSLTTEKDLLMKQRNQVHSREDAISFNARVTSYNENVDLLNSQITKYNDLVAEYKVVALEAQELYKSLDSRPTF